jgi:HEPN domain-containing protein
MNDKANELFDDAVEKLNEANEELFRPNEDIATYLVCKNAQVAIENYLKGFLLQNNIDPSDYKTIDTLFEQCKKININFEKVDLSDFECKSHKLDSRYCDEVSKVSNCFEIADNLDTFFRREKIIN